MSTKRLDEEAIFNAARRIDSAEGRATFISQACGDDAGLAGRVGALLDMFERDPQFMEAPRPNGTVDYEPIAERPGSKIGPYRLMEQIGEGGFGLVFVAEQQEPVRRKVALKVIKPGMDSRQVIARFEAERQAIALMDHPNIARVLDAGATESGRPYFVMELVRGIPITEYCDKNQLAPRERLALFVTVCQAVQHAHQKGIIHRDIKPSNVLVTSHDGKPVAKVIDFGVAKAVTQQLTERTIYTQFSQMIGTPLYMSPEQAEMSGLDIDTRTDIYSLGVLLYELLTGTTPFDKARFAKAAYDEIRRMIREDEPQKPSTRISQSGESLPSVAAQRKMEPAKLSKLMRGDLDWITMKALEKDRTRRYETASGMARDIERYLCDEPVEACPPSPGYRLRKLVRRHKSALGIAASFAALLIVGTVVSFGLAVLAHRAEAMARAEADAAEYARVQAAAERDRAQIAGQAETQQRQLAESERDAKDLALGRAEGNRLIAEATAVLSKNPGLSLLVALEAAKRQPGKLANNSLLAALDACHEERTLIGHQSEVRSASFSPDGKRILSISAQSRDSMVRLWDAVTGKQTGELVPFCFHTAEAIFSPDGKYMVTRYEGYTDLYAKKGGGKRHLDDEMVYLWDAATGKPLFLLHGHKDRVTSAEFSSDSRRLITASWDRTARIWDVATGNEIQKFEMPSSLCAARFSPNGQQVLTVLAGANYSRYGHGTSRRPDKIELPQPSDLEPIDLNTWSGSSFGGGSMFTSGPYNVQAVARTWDTATGKQLSEFKRPSGFAFLRLDDGKFSPDGCCVMLRGKKTFYIWEPDTEKVLATINTVESIYSHQPFEIADAAFSPDSKSYVVATNQDATVYETATGAFLFTVRHDQAVTGVAFSRDGYGLATSSADKTARMWSAVAGDEIAVFKGHEQAVKSVAFSPDGLKVVTASDDRTVRIWQVQPRRDFARQFESHRGPVLDLAFSPDGRRFATATKGASTMIWDVGSAKQIHVLQGHADLGSSPARDQILGPVKMVRFSPDGNRIVTAGDDTRAHYEKRILGFKMGGRDLPFTPVRLWDAQSGKEAIGLQSHESGVDFVQFSADGSRLLTVEDGVQHQVNYDSALGVVITGTWNTNRWGRTARVWNAQTGQLLSAMTVKDAALVSAMLSADGRRVVTSLGVNPSDCPVRIWDAATGSELLRLEQGSGDMYAAFSPDGSRVYTFPTNIARCYDAATGKELARFDDQFEGTRYPITSVVFSPDGRQMTTIANDCVWTWDPATLKPLMVLGGHERKVCSAAYSADGKLIVTASEDETARIWDATTGEERYTLVGHRGPVRAAIFSPDGQTVATASDDGSARVWPIDPLPIAKASKPRELTPAERKRFRIESAN